MPNRIPWDEEDDDQTPYGVSGEALPPRPDVVGDADMDDRYAKPRRKKGIPVEEGQEEDQPPADQPVRRKKRRKADRVIYAPDPNDVRDQANEQREWIITGTLFVIGFALLLAGSVGLAGRKDFEELGTATLVLSGILSIAIGIPLTIVALTVGGSVLGIGYGTPVSAIRNIAAIFMFLEGLNCVFAWAGMPFVGWILTLLIGFGLVMNRFELDIWEIWATVIAMRVVGFVIHVGSLLLLSGIVSKKERAMDMDLNPAVITARMTDGGPTVREGLGSIPPLRSGIRNTLA